MENPAGIVFYGTKWCYGSLKSENFLKEHGIEYKWVDIDKDAEGRSFVKEVNKGMASVPTILFPDGDILVEPSIRRLADKLGLNPT